jgi:hypothetical protein
MNKQLNLDDVKGATVTAVSTERALVVAPQAPHHGEPDPDDFDWNNRESVVLREQPETAIYLNPFDEIVIRQRKWPDEDAFVYFTPGDNLQAVIDRLCDLAGIPSAGK